MSAADSKFEIYDFESGVLHFIVLMTHLFYVAFVLYDNFVSYVYYATQDVCLFVQFYI